MNLEIPFLIIPLIHLSLIYSPFSFFFIDSEVLIEFGFYSSYGYKSTAFISLSRALISFTLTKQNSLVILGIISLNCGNVNYYDFELLLSYLKIKIILFFGKINPKSLQNEINSP